MQLFGEDDVKKFIEDDYYGHVHSVLCSPCRFMSLNARHFVWRCMLLSLGKAEINEL